MDHQTPPSDPHGEDFPLTVARHRAMLLVFIAGQLLMHPDVEDEAEADAFARAHYDDLLHYLGLSVQEYFEEVRDQEDDPDDDDPGADDDEGPEGGESRILTGLEELARNKDRAQEASRASEDFWNGEAGQAILAQADRLRAMARDVLLNQREGGPPGEDLGKNDLSCEIEEIEERLEWSFPEEPAVMNLDFYPRHFGAGEIVKAALNAAAHMICFERGFWGLPVPQGDQSLDSYLMQQYGDGKRITVVAAEDQPASDN